MSIIIEFHAGDATAIGAAIGADDFDALDAASRAKADFSLHLDPMALDDLSELMGAPPLFESLGRGLSDGANVVAAQWVDAVGRVPPVSAGTLAQDWLRQQGADADSSDAAKAIGALISLCRRAREQSWDVVFWIST